MSHPLPARSSTRPPATGRELHFALVATVRVVNTATRATGFRNARAGTQRGPSCEWTQTTIAPATGRVVSLDHLSERDELTGVSPLHQDADQRGQHRARRGSPQCDAQ